MRRTDREVTDYNEMEEIIRSCQVCHMAMVDQGNPYSVTVNFGYERKEQQFILFVHCAAQGRKIDILKQNPKVFITMDHNHELVKGNEACSYGWKYESIMAEGKVEFLASEAEKRSGLDAIMRQYETHTVFTYPDRAVERVTVLRIALQQITAKRRR